MRKVELGISKLLFYGLYYFVILLPLYSNNSELLLFWGFRAGQVADSVWIRLGKNWWHFAPEKGIPFFVCVC